MQRSPALIQRLLRLQGWLEWSERIYRIRQRAESSIRAVKSFKNILLQPRRFLNPTFALQCPQIHCLAGIQLHHVYVIPDYGWGQEYEQVELLNR